MFDRMVAMTRRWRVKTLKPFGDVPPGVLRVSLGDLNINVADALATGFANVNGVEWWQATFWISAATPSSVPRTASAIWVAELIRRSTTFTTEPLSLRSR